MYKYVLYYLKFKYLFRESCDYELTHSNFYLTKHGYLENMDMNETEIIEFSVPMWADVNYYETIRLDKMHCKSYLLRTLR